MLYFICNRATDFLHFILSYANTWLYINVNILTDKILKKCFFNRLINQNISNALAVHTQGPPKGHEPPVEDRFTVMIKSHASTVASLDELACKNVRPRLGMRLNQLVSAAQLFNF